MRSRRAPGAPGRGGRRGDRRPALRRRPPPDAVRRVRRRGSRAAVELAGFLMTPDAAFGYERRGTPATARGARRERRVRRRRRAAVRARRPGGAQLGHPGGDRRGRPGRAERLLGRPYASRRRSTRRSPAFALADGDAAGRAISVPDRRATRSRPSTLRGVCVAGSARRTTRAVEFSHDRAAMAPRPAERRPAARPVDDARDRGLRGRARPDQRARRGEPGLVWRLQTDEGNATTSTPSTTTCSSSTCGLGVDRGAPRVHLHDRPRRRPAPAPRMVRAAVERAPRAVVDRRPATCRRSRRPSSASRACAATARRPPPSPSAPRSSRRRPPRCAARRRRVLLADRGRGPDRVGEQGPAPQPVQRRARSFSPGPASRATVRRS